VAPFSGGAPLRAAGQHHFLRPWRQGQVEFGDLIENTDFPNSRFLSPLPDDAPLSSDEGVPVGNA
jgi:hypothetical protein